MKLEPITEIPRDFVPNAYSQKQWDAAGMRSKALCARSVMWCWRNDRPLAVLGVGEGAWLGPKEMWFMVADGMTFREFYRGAKVFKAMDLPPLQAHVEDGVEICTRFAAAFGFVPTPYEFQGFRTWVRY